jgi:class 3 adenylate cyclase/predicted alpha/beta hydrolase
VSIAFQVFGDGPRDLVVAPGFMSHLDLQWTVPSFAEFAERLAAFSRVIIFDKRGTGLSDPAPGADRFDTRMDDVRAVMDAAASESASLLGMSEGGPLAALFAATFPHRVERLVLFGTFARGSIIEEATFARLAEAVRNWGQGLTADIFSAQVSPLRRRVAGMMERASASPSMARALLAAIAEADVSAVLPSLHVPTLVVHRAGDPFAPASWSDEIADLVPSAARLELDGDEHVPWLGDVSSIAAAVERFVAGRTVRPEGRRILATVMFTDIVSSTEKAAALGDMAWRSLLDRHNAVVRDEIAGHDGEEVKFTGDGFLLRFQSPARAIDCARRLVRRLEEIDIAIRVGIHTGEAEMIDDRELAGVAVHIAARIMALARPGEILVSGTVKDLVVGSPHTFVERGSHQLKGAPGSWTLYSVADAERIVIDITGPQLRMGDRLSVFLARQAPHAVRAVAQSLLPDQ